MATSCATSMKEGRHMLMTKSAASTLLFGPLAGLHPTGTRKPPDAPRPWCSARARSKSLDAHGVALGIRVLQEVANERGADRPAPRMTMRLDMPQFGGGPAIPKPHGPGILARDLSTSCRPLAHFHPYSPPSTPRLAHDAPSICSFSLGTAPLLTACNGPKAFSKRAVSCMPPDSGSKRPISTTWHCASDRDTWTP